MNSLRSSAQTKSTLTTTFQNTSEYPAHRLRVGCARHRDDSRPRHTVSFPIPAFEDASWCCRGADGGRGQIPSWFTLVTANSGTRSRARNRRYRARDARRTRRRKEKKFLAYMSLGCRGLLTSCGTPSPTRYRGLRLSLGSCIIVRISMSQVADDSCPGATPHVSRVAMLTICRTRGGIYATQNDVRATSVELWLKALGASPSLISLHSRF
jgi:hypothetical protein